MNILTLEKLSRKRSGDDHHESGQTGDSEEAYLENRPEFSEGKIIHYNRFYGSGRSKLL